MTPNISISIEETENGYIVRPLDESQKPAIGRNAVVATTLDGLERWIGQHFRRWG